MIADEQLRGVLQFVVDTAAGDARRLPPVPAAPPLRPHLRSRRLPVKALAAVRAALDADDGLRRQFADRVTDVVDEVGRLWLQRPEGWESAVAELLREAPATVAAAHERRREGAERALTKERAEHAATRDLLVAERRQHDAAVARAGQAEAEVARLQRRVTELEAALGKAERRAVRAAERADAADARAGAAVAAEPAPSPGPDLGALRDLLQRAVQEVEALATASAVPAARSRPEPPPRRVPVKVPHGRLAHEPEAVEHLLRTPGARVFVDGYNVAKLGWPQLDLAHQRDACLDAVESLASRWALDVTVVFDGADVVGATADGRRAVHVVFSQPPAIADDVLRAMVGQVDVAVPVVVVTSDRQIVRDVGRRGANTVPSADFLALALAPR